MGIPLNTAAKRPFLTLVQNACDEIGLAPPAAMIGATDDQSRQLLALSNREGEEFSKLANGNGGWEELYSEYAFTTNAFTSTGNTTNGSAVITNIPSTALLSATQWSLSGTGIPNYPTIVSVDSATQITLDRPCTATGTGVVLSFGQVAYPMPADFEYYISQTFWQGSYRWQLLGPLEAQEKQVLKYGISPVGPRARFWVRGNYFFIQPIPSNSTDVNAFDYYSNAWCQSSTQVGQVRWTADTDYYTLDDDCFVLGLKWRFLRAKGLDYGEERKTYDDACARQLGRNGGNRTILLNAQSFGQRLLNSQNVPDTGYGS